MKKIDTSERQLNIRVTQKMKDQLEELAQYHDLSQTDIIKQALRREYRAMLREREAEANPLKIGGHSV